VANQLSNFVRSVTKETFLPVVVPNFYTGNALFMRLRDKRRTWDSGTAMRIPTEVLGRTQGGSYSGADTFGTAQEDVRQQFVIYPSQYYWTVTITGIQAAANRGREAIVNLMTEEFRSVGRALRNDMGNDLYLDGTGNANKDLTGLVAHVDDGTNVATYQGLSRTTYPTLASTVTAQSGALALSNLASDFDAAQVDNDEPTIGITTKSVFSIVEALYTATSRYQIVAYANERIRLTAAGIEKAGNTANVGFTGLMFRGMPLVSDERCTAGNMYFLNEKYLNLYEMPMHPDFVDGTVENFGWTGWKKPTNQDVIVGQLLWYGQLIGEQPRKNTRRTAITS
jgi:hypothetical protein